MKPAFRRVLVPVLGALSVVGLAATAGNAVTDPAPIGPDQFFTGDVNGLQANGVITTDCVGPIVPGATGRPIGNQFVAVLPGPATGANVSVGFTGSLGNSVEAVLVFPNGSVSGIVLGTVHDYVVRLPIPTDITVPCNGPADVRFIPQPNSPSAKSADVNVTLRSIGV
jgi:hypothetical protein